MSTPLPSSGAISMLTLGNYLGMARDIKLSGSHTPLSMNQIFFSKVNTTTPVSNTVSMNSFYGRTFSAYTNSTRTNQVVLPLSNRIDGDITIYLGIGTPKAGQSGSLYQYNRGMPVKIRIEPIFGDLSELDCFVKTGTSSWSTALFYGFQLKDPMLYEKTDLFHELRFTTNRDTISRFILTLIPSLDGVTEGSGIHRIEYDLQYFDREPSSGFRR